MSATRKAILSAKRKALFLPKLLRGAISYPRESNICLWHAGRCGSTVLARLVSGDGRVNWKGEYLEKRSKAVEGGKVDAETAWSSGIRALRNEHFCSDQRPFGVELKLWHATRMKKDVAAVYDTLQSIGFNRHVILERRNYLRIFLSGQVRLASGVTHTTDESNVFREQIRVDTGDALRQVAIVADFYEELKAILPSDRLYLCYEDHIFDDPIVGYRLFLDYVGLDPRDGRVQLKKTNSRPAGDIVANWSELVDAFSRTPYAWMTQE